jgi:hypothetical protein
MLAASSLIQFTRRKFVTALALTAAGLTGNQTNAESSVQKSSLSNRFIGVWRYRSFRNVTNVAQKLDDILFWEAELSLNDKGDGHVEGVIGDASDKLNVRGSSTFGFPNYIRFEANGIPGTSTEGWKYNYAGFLAPDWPDGVDQQDAIVGTVIRSVAHSNGKAKAGYVASFVAVRMS